MRRKVTKHDIAEFLDAVFDELLGTRGMRDAAFRSCAAPRVRAKARDCASVRRHRR